MTVIDINMERVQKHSFFSFKPYKRPDTIPRVSAAAALSLGAELLYQVLHL
jgi:hypothetical protein